MIPYDITKGKDIAKAWNTIKDVLADYADYFEYQAIYSLNRNECEESGGDWNTVSPIILNYLRDLDSKEGYIYWDDNLACWDFRENKKDTFHGHDICKIQAGEGLVVFNNLNAGFDFDIPFVVIKENFWNQYSEKIVDELLIQKPEIDYTGILSPAVYIELYSV